MKPSLFSRILISAPFLLPVSQVWANIPENQKPSKGGSNNLLTLIFQYAYDIALYGGSIFLAGSALYLMAHLWDLYSKTKDKQATKKDLLTDAVLGAVLLLLSIWGLNYGLDLLGDV
ncbi:integrating conjugative element membrane protein (plasmid) [Vibrio azureus]|uniref:Integrating conjugative element membrane protein n=1 Tax=Vibrio azureus NBRC 104587 TaxID=1219077 RepID=U3ASH5_9VIBR|nr:DUF2976 domain-containing protein [Vibrio azureus]AUI88936.1 integrating conjugative element membrane protein [Vibrio azureus]GAD76202.1 hypothetical protein VAZ01S_039_00270 [Vibrio azureus NBRC 104587]